eukprot:3807320-Pyramimonas_sp.AAC.2
MPAPVKDHGRPHLPGWIFPDDWDYVPVNFPHRDDVHDFITPTGTIHSSDLRPPTLLRTAWGKASKGVAQRLGPPWPTLRAAHGAPCQ